MELREKEVDTVIINLFPVLKNVEENMNMMKGGKEDMEKTKTELLKLKNKKSKIRHCRGLDTTRKYK